MIKNIIVEGADQQGKSEVCKMLKYMLGWNVEHFSLPIPVDFDFHGDYLLPPKFISDRSYLSELAYCHFRDGKSRVIEKDILEHRMNTRGTLLILCDRGDSYKYDDRDECFSEDQILKVREIYKGLYDGVRMTKLKINPTVGLKWLESYVRMLVNKR
jgi:thymidylate kinase